MLLGAVTVPAATDGRHRDKPSRVLIIMLDQARPDTIERYDMDNVKELMRKCTSLGTTASPASHAWRRTAGRAAKQAWAPQGPGMSPIAAPAAAIGHAFGREP